MQRTRYLRNQDFDEEEEKLIPEEDLEEELTEEEAEDLGIIIEAAKRYSGEDEPNKKELEAISKTLDMPKIRESVHVPGMLEPFDYGEFDVTYESIPWDEVMVFDEEYPRVTLNQLRKEFKDYSPGWYLVSETEKAFGSFENFDDIVDFARNIISDL